MQQTAQSVKDDMNQYLQQQREVITVIFISAFSITVVFLVEVNACCYFVSSLWSFVVLASDEGEFAE